MKINHKTGNNVRKHTQRNVSYKPPFSEYYTKYLKEDFGQNIFFVKTSQTAKPQQMNSGHWTTFEDNPSKYITYCVSKVIDVLSIHMQMALFRMKLQLYNDYSVIFTYTTKYSKFILCLLPYS